MIGATSVLDRTDGLLVCIKQMMGPSGSTAVEAADDGLAANNAQRDTIRNFQDKTAMTNTHLERLDEIAREAWEGNYDRVGPLSTGERLYVALASGRMRELAPGDSIAYAVDRVGSEWMEHMLQVWRSTPQPRT